MLTGSTCGQFCLLVPKSDLGISLTELNGFYFEIIRHRIGLQQYQVSSTKDSRKEDNGARSMLQRYNVCS